MATTSFKKTCHAGINEAPSPRIVAKLVEAALLGVTPSVAAAYAETTHTIVKSWLMRGYREDVEPFDPSIHKDEDVRDHHIQFHKKVTIPCFAFWKAWQQARSKFVMRCVNKLGRSRSWQAQAWLLERLEPSIFVKPGMPAAIKRDLLPYEKEVEAAVVDNDPANTHDVVQIILPSNRR